MVTRLRSKCLGALLGAVILVLSMAAAVLAEGSWSSSLSGVNRGFESRTWWDNANDAASTRVRFRDCNDRDSGSSPANVYAKLQLLRFAGIFPWEDRGQIGLACYDGATFDWGAQRGPGETHKWKVLDFSGGGGGNRLDVRSLTTYY